MITFIFIMCSEEIIHSSFSEVLGAMLLDVCIVTTLVLPFFEKSKWKGIRGYFGYIIDILTLHY